MLAAFKAPTRSAAQCSREADRQAPRRDREAKLIFPQGRIASPYSQL